jgi:1-acyl-sn-glycerol-3-phosphate acyltransferase
MVANKQTAAPKQAVVHVQAGRAAPAPLWVKAARLTVRGIFRLFFRLRVIGREHVPRTPVIICVNHLGWTDPFLILLLLPVEPRIYVLGEREGVLQTDFRTRFIDAFQIMIPLDRDRPLEAMRVMLGLLRRGGSLLIFPEGNLGTQEGTIQALQPGAAHLSLQSGVPLLPVGITGSQELWLRRTLTLRIGPPIDPTAFAEGNTRSRIGAMTAALDTALRALLPGDRIQPRRKPLRGWLTNLF